MDRSKQETVPAILKTLAASLNTEVRNRRLEIPKKYGKGYCRGFVFNQHIRMLISNYELKEDILIGNTEINSLREMIFFKFRNITPLVERLAAEKSINEIPSVLIATSRLNTDEVIAIHSNVATINIEVDVNYLKGLFDLPEQSLVLQSLLKNTQPLLFEQVVYAALQKTIDEIITETVNETFELFFLKVKAEELICRLLMELEKRHEKNLYALNGSDVQNIYKVKKQILTDLGTPPVIDKLAKLANMSPSKLKRLFKQIFGNSIFNYYQQFRMQEAARLLKEEKLSVSEVGYRLGFSNLSHFTRIFEKHIGLRPKKYSLI